MPSPNQPIAFLKIRARPNMVGLVSVWLSGRNPKSSTLKKATLKITDTPENHHIISKALWPLRQKGILVCSAVNTGNNSKNESYPGNGLK